MIDPFAHLLILIVWFGVVCWGASLLWRDVLSVEPPRENKRIVIHEQPERSAEPMKIYRSFKEFLAKAGRYIIHCRQREKQEQAKHHEQALRDIRKRAKASGLRVRVTKSPTYGFKATLRGDTAGLYIGHGPTELGAIEDALESDQFIYPVTGSKVQKESLKYGGVS